MKLSHTEAVEHLKNGFQIILHWSSESYRVYHDVLSLGGESYRLLYTYLDDNLYETLILFPDGSDNEGIQPLSVRKTGMSMILQDIFHGWKEASWSDRERMIGIALTLIDSDAHSMYYHKAYHKELGRRRNHG